MERQIIPNAGQVFLGQAVPGTLEICFLECLAVSPGELGVHVLQHAGDGLKRLTATVDQPWDAQPDNLGLCAGLASKAAVRHMRVWEAECSPPAKGT